MIKIIAGGDFAAWAIDVQKNRGDRIIVSGLADLENGIIDHTGTNLTGDFLGNDTKEVNLRDAFSLTLVPFDKFLFKGGRGVDRGRAGEEALVLEEEEEIGDEAGSEQNQTHHEKKFRKASHARCEDASD